MRNKLALIFPGQGSQYVGMGQDLYGRYAEARALFDEADDVLGLPLSRLCFEGPEDELRDTVNTQPAIVTMSLAALRAIEIRHGVEGVAFTAGHSLGEYSALVAAGHMSFADAVRLVRERGRLMKQAGEECPGAMVAVLGLDAGLVEEACLEASEETGQVVEVANYNSPLQTVISGEQAGLQKAIALARSKGARRAVPLAVSIASHSRLMEAAAKGLRNAIASVTFQETEVPVIANVTAEPLVNPRQIEEELVEQLVRPVQWVDTVRHMVNDGVTTFAEIGPQDVLSKLIKRIDPRVARTTVGDVAAVEAWRP